MRETSDNLNSRPMETGLALPLDVVAELRLEGFVHTFPDITLDTLTAYVQANFEWAIHLPRVQAKMIQLVTASMGQLPA